MNCHLLSIEERSCIRKYYVDGLSCREIARLADHLPVELRKTPDKRQPESAAAQREEPWSERNTREIQQREVDSKKRQVGIQPSGSRSPGSRYDGERPGQKQSPLCRFGRAQNTVLHCREDTGPKSRDNGKRYCCCTVCLPCAAGQGHYLCSGYGVCQLAPYGRTVALRGLLYRPVLRLAERRN